MRARKRLRIAALGLAVPSLVVSWTLLASNDVGASYITDTTVRVVGVPQANSRLVAGTTAEAEVAGPDKHKLTGPYTVDRYVHLAATLSDASGAPIKSQTLVFSVNGTTICSAVTNTKGVAKCGAKGRKTLPQIAVLPGTFVATFGGSAGVSAATASGTLARS